MKSVLSIEEYLAARTPPGHEVDVDMIHAMDVSMRKRGTCEVYDDREVSDDDPVYRQADLNMAFTECVICGMRSAQLDGSPGGCNHPESRYTSNLNPTKGISI